MAEPFSMTLPPERLGEVESLMAEHDRAGMGDEDLQKRLGKMGARQAPGADPILDKMARLARQRRAMRDIIGKQPTPTKVEQYIPSAERVEPGVLGSTKPEIDPVDVLTGGLLGKGGAAAAKTGVSEAIQSGVEKVAGMAGLPPIVRQVLGLGAGLAPLGSAPRRPNAKVPPRSLARVPDEVLPPLPPRQIGQAQPNVPATIPPEYIPPRFNAPRAGEFGAARDVGRYNPEQITSQQRLAPPNLRLPPPTIRVGPEGPEKFTDVPQSVARPQRQRRTFETLTEPSVSAKRTSRGIQPFESGRGTQPPGEPSDPTPIPPTPEEIGTDIRESAEDLPRMIRAAPDPRIARQQYGNVVRQAFSPGAAGGNPYSVPGIRDLQAKIRQFGPENLPSRGRLSRADFADRIARQRQRDTTNAVAQLGPRARLTPRREEYHGRMLAAGSMTPGDRVITPQGPGRVIERIKGAVTGRSINEIMAGRGSRVEGRQQSDTQESYAAAPASSVRVRLDDGREGTWSSWNVLRPKDEAGSVGPIQQLDEAAREKIRGAKPRREPATLPRQPESEDPEVGGDEDFDWSTGEYKNR